MPQDTDTARRTSALHRTFPARLEVEPAPIDEVAPRYPNLRSTLRDPLSVVLVAGTCLAQVADTITTAIALSGPGFVERNALMRAAVTAPWQIGSLKVVLALLVCLLAMLRLPTRYARLALAFAFALSAFAPVQNTVQLLLHG